MATDDEQCYTEHNLQELRWDELRAVSPFSGWGYIKIQMTTPPFDLGAYIKAAIRFLEIPDTFQHFMQNRPSAEVMRELLQEVVKQIAAVITHLMGSQTDIPDW